VEAKVPLRYACRATTWVLTARVSAAAVLRAVRLETIQEKTGCRPPRLVYEDAWAVLALFEASLRTLQKVSSASPPCYSILQRDRQDAAWAVLAVGLDVRAERQEMIRRELTRQETS